MHGFKILHRDDLNKNGNSIDETTHAWLYIFLNSEFDSFVKNTDKFKFSDFLSLDFGAVHRKYLADHLEKC